LLFNSIKFGIFLPIVFFAYWIVPKKFRWLVILISSYYFYMSWDVKYVTLILFTTIISYICAIILKRTDKKSIKKCSIAITIIACLGVLVAFKYFNFFADSFSDLMQSFGWNITPLTLNIVLPVGISFYTFQNLSYVIDVYRKDVEAETHFGKYAAFISFFPQLVAGPIERSKNLLPQITNPKDFDYNSATYGMKLMAWGFFKKIVVADTMAIYVDKIYNNPQKYTGLALILATLFFAFQIYCDFSGYSDIAIGVAKLFNINLMTNFASPYFSLSIKEFWSRWHISLSTWFKDYIYIPLGGNRCKKPRYIFNLITTFTISGLWHGANWTYVVWGLIHGCGQAIESLFIKKKKYKKSKLSKILSIIFVFIFCTIGWVFFRAESFEDAIYILTNGFVGITKPINYIITASINLGLIPWDYADIIIALLVLSIFDFFNKKCDVINKISCLKLVPRWSIYITFILLILALLPENTGGEFIYFQF